MLRIVLYIMTMCEMTFLLKTQVSLLCETNERKKAKDRQRSKKLKKLLCLFSFCEKKVLSDDDEKEKQKETLQELGITTF